MAIYHLSAKTISRGRGQSVVASASYRSAEKLHDERLNYTYDFSRKENVAHTEILLPVNAPSRLSDRATLWNEVEQAERRKDAQLAREVEVALPVELSANEQLNLVRSFAHNEFVTKGMIADLAIHDKDGNPHCHILLTMRDISTEGFLKKNRSWNNKEVLKSWRKNWEVAINKELEKKHISKRVSCETLEAQGIDRIPTVHVGVFHAQENRLRNEKIAKLNLEILKTKRLLELEKGKLNQPPAAENVRLQEGFELAYARQMKFTPPKLADEVTLRVLKKAGYDEAEQAIICNAFNKTLTDLKAKAKQGGMTVKNYAQEVGLSKNEIVNILNACKNIVQEKMENSRSR